MKVQYEFSMTTLVRIVDREGLVMDRGEGKDVLQVVSIENNENMPPRKHLLVCHIEGWSSSNFEDTFSRK